MEDEKIVALFWARQELAISEATTKYAAYLTTICQRILQNRQDAEECVNDVFCRAWATIPPHRPKALRLYLGKIARNLSLHRQESCHAQKRGGGMVALALTELEDCIPAQETVESALTARRLGEEINKFLAGLTREHRILFVRRYWYLCSVRELATELHLSESAVKSTLFRLRNALRLHLEKEEILE